MAEWYTVTADTKHIAHQRERARKLRKSQWWQNQVARGVCHYCQQAFLPKDLTMDHVVPIARGGCSTRGNVVPACKKCNTEKKLATPVDMVLHKR